MKLILKVVFFMLIILTMLSSKCKKRIDSENCHYRVPRQNNSDKSLYIDVSIDYPDTVLGNGKYTGYPNPLHNPQFCNVKPHSILSYPSELCIETHYLREIKSGYLMFFIYEEETLRNNDWEKMKKNNMYLQRYDLSLQDLRKLNFTIPYPPTPEMKDMKMWPKYRP